MTLILKTLYLNNVSSYCSSCQAVRTRLLILHNKVATSSTTVSVLSSHYKWHQAEAERLHDAAQML